MAPPFLRRHAFALMAFCLTLALRLLALARLFDSPYGLPVTSDMKFYADWGRRIAAGQWTDGHAFYAQPLYAYFLGGIFALAGYQPFWVGLIQTFVDAATALLIFQIASHVFAHHTPRTRLWIASLAAAGWAFYVPAAAYCGLMIPTPFVTASWWFMVWWILRRSASARGIEWLGVACLIGVAALISAATLFSVMLLLATLLLQRRPQFVFAVMAGVIIGTAPAWMHNVITARDPVFISAHSGVNFWIGNHPGAIGYPKVPAELPSDQRALLEESIRVAERVAGRVLPRSAVSQYWSGRTWDYIAAHPFDWLKLLSMKLKNFWNAFAYDDLSSITPLRDARVILPGLHFGILAALGIPGAIFAFQIPKARWIIAAIGLQMIALLPVFINERYRLPAAPGLLLLSAFFVTKLFALVLNPKLPALLGAACLLFLSTVFISLPPHDPTLLSVDDFKAGRRQLLANDFAHSEMRLRRAAAVVVPAGKVDALVAKAFLEAAREKWLLGQRRDARETIAIAARLNANDAEVAQLRNEMTAGAQ